MVEINEDKLWENYKKIETVCIVEGELIPQLLERWLPVEYGGMPDKYRLSDKEKQELFNKRDEKTNRKLEQLWLNRRKTENEIIQNNNDKYNSLGEYVEDELKTFIRKHPEFKEIIK